MKSSIALRLFLFIALLGGASARAGEGHETGNGGGAWACQNARGFPEWLQVVDLYEGRTEFKLNIPEAEHGMYLEIVDQMLETRLRAVAPELHRTVKAALAQVLKNLVLIEADLATIDDALYRIQPRADDCLGGTIAYRQLANYTPYGKILLQVPLFWQLSETGRAALILHEAIYADLRARVGDAHSGRTRRIVGLLFSDLPLPELRAELARILALKKT